MRKHRQTQTQIQTQTQTQIQIQTQIQRRMHSCQAPVHSRGSAPSIPAFKRKLVPLSKRSSFQRRQMFSLLQIHLLTSPMLLKYVCTLQPVSSDGVSHSLTQYRQIISPPELGRQLNTTMLIVGQVCLTHGSALCHSVFNTLHSVSQCVQHTAVFHSVFNSRHGV